MHHAERPYWRASSIMSATRRSSPSRPRGMQRWVERCCPSTRQARRSEIPEPVTDMIDTLATARGAQKFPRAAP